MHIAFLICEATALKMLLLYKSLYLTYDLQKRRIKCEDNFACAQMKGIIAVTQRGEEREEYKT